MKKRNYWRLTAIIIILFISRFKFSKETTVLMTKAVFSREFFSSFFGAAVAACITLYVFFKQSKQAENIMKTQIETQENQLNQQLESSNIQFKDQQEMAKLQFQTQIEVQTEQFNKQQIFEFKKIEIEYYLEKVQEVNNLLLRVKEITENGFKPLTIRMTELQTDLRSNQNKELFHLYFKKNLPQIEALYLEYYKFSIEIHEISNKLIVFSELFDTGLSKHILDFVRGEFGLEFYETNLVEIWWENNIQNSYKKYSEHKSENFDNIVPTLKIYEKVLNLDQRVIPFEIKNKHSELKELTYKNIT
ncbi:hypothetical protein [Streptococcus parauberis]|uniref:Uncharacterized protein n=1 Tax=Streptococcus parauberis NCFD 2020 TaxID=873447 RepID=F1YY14_9STRE|nr:hypothetical protein [Streptococcus parauberis]EGE53833.1 hypothetical protein SPB_0212 [Streptococcus parauberis NCFD 2020]